MGPAGFGCRYWIFANDGERAIAGSAKLLHHDPVALDFVQFELRFFYNLLSNARRDLPEMTPRLSTDDPEAFRLYFSAFIQSARSVTWAIGNEGKDKWEAWKPKWNADSSEEDQKLKDLTNDLRIAEKLGGADLPEEVVEVAIQATIETKPWTHWERDGIGRGVWVVSVCAKEGAASNLLF
jgi:hypothetical protein